MTAQDPTALVAELREAVRRCDGLLDQRLRDGAPIEESIDVADRLDDYHRRLRAAEAATEGATE